MLVSLTSVGIIQFIAPTILTTCFSKKLKNSATGKTRAFCVPLTSPLYTHHPTLFLFVDYWTIYETFCYKHATRERTSPYRLNGFFTASDMEFD